MSKTTKRKTAGELNHAALTDKTKYDPLEIAHARLEEVMENLQKCGKDHEDIFGEEVYTVILTVAEDPLLKSVRRQKYHAFLYMPQPRPNQSVFLYKKGVGIVKRLWSLPSAHVMAVISEMGNVSPQWRDTKRWCDSFFNKTFYEDIRHEHGISMLSEHEYLVANMDELKRHCNEVVEPLKDDVSSEDPYAFDFSKVTTKQVVDPAVSISE